MLLKTLEKTKKYLIMSIALILFIFAGNFKVFAAGESIYFKQITKLKMGSQFKVQIIVDSKSTLVNGVTADFTYPADKLTFSSVDFTGASFGEIGPTPSITPGNASITRSTVSSFSGSNLLLATVVFDVISDSSTINLNWQNTTILANAGDNIPIIKTNGVFTKINGTVYRLVNWYTKERLFTTSSFERDYAVKTYPGWSYEGVSFYYFTLIQVTRLINKTAYLRYLPYPDFSNCFAIKCS